MVRNLDHRVEVTCPILDEGIGKELKEILNIQLSDNVKARWLDNELLNRYKRDQPENRIRSQIEIYNYLYQKAMPAEEGAGQIREQAVTG
jgi:polyphosphate kinase